MTSKQIQKALTAAGIEMTNIECRRDEIEIYVPEAGEQYADRDATTELLEKVALVFDWAGFATGYGAWILQKDYQSNGDYSDPSSRWHY